MVSLFICNMWHANFPSIATGIMQESQKSCVFINNELHACFQSYLLQQLQVFAKCMKATKMEVSNTPLWNVSTQDKLYARSYTLVFHVGLGEHIENTINKKIDLMSICYWLSAYWIEFQWYKTGLCSWKYLLCNLVSVATNLRLAPNIPVTTSPQ